MPQPKKPAARKALPVLSVAHFEEALGLIEVLVDENTDVFIAKGQDYRSRHRSGTERPLTAAEAAQVASAMASGAGLPPVALAVAVQESDLRAYDEPEPMELLLRAGVATAPAFMQTVKRFTALIEMPAADLERDREAGTLPDALDVAARKLDYADLADARDRSQAALEHFAAGAGAGPGKAVGLLLQALGQAMMQATSALGLQRGPSSLTGSPPSTDGLAAASSTTPLTATP
jgi:hypothetical protein